MASHSSVVPTQSIFFLGNLQTVKWLSQRINNSSGSATHGILNGEETNRHEAHMARKRAGSAGWVRPTMTRPRRSCGSSDHGAYSSYATSLHGIGRKATS